MDIGKAQPLAIQKVDNQTLESWWGMGEQETIIIGKDDVRIHASKWASLLSKPYQYKPEHWQVLDHVWNNKKWRHRMRDVRFDARANLRGSHSPIIAFFFRYPCRQE